MEPVKQEGLIPIFFNAKKQKFRYFMSFFCPQGDLVIQFFSANLRRCFGETKKTVKISRIMENNNLKSIWKNRLMKTGIVEVYFSK